MSFDFVSIRAAIARTVESIPEIKRVHQYAGRYEGRGNLPYASLVRGVILNPQVSLDGEAVGTEGLGQYISLVSWTINVYAQIQNQVDAQALDDLFSMRLTDVFNANRLLDANGPGIVENSRITQIVPFAVEDSGVWMTEATLMTRIQSQ